MKRKVKRFGVTKNAMAGVDMLTFDGVTGLSPKQAEEASMLLENFEKLEAACLALLEQRVSSWHRFAEEGDEPPDVIKEAAEALGIDWHKYME